MTDLERAIQVAQELAASIKDLEEAVRALQYTVEVWETAEDEAIELINRQTH